MECMCVYVCVHVGGGRCIHAPDERSIADKQISFQKSWERG